MKSKPSYDELHQRIEDLRSKAFEKDSILEQLQPIFNYSLDMIGSGNLKGYFTKVNPSFEQVLGYQEQEFLRSPFIDFIHEEDVEKTREALQAAASGRREISITNRYRCKDGSYKWIDWRVQAFVADNLFIAVGRDITAKKALEDELRLSERRHRNIIQTSSDGFIQMDDQGRITDCNTSYLRMSGYSRNELLAMRISDLEALETSAETENHIQQIIESGWASFESVHRRKDGATFDVEVRTTYIYEENIFVAFLRDISERNRTLAAIRESEERFRQLAENIREVFWLGSLDWHEVYYVSPAYEEVWGKGCESLYTNSLSWMDSVLDEDREKVLKAIPVTLDESTTEIVFPEYRIRNTKGEIRWIGARAFPIRDNAGKPYRIAGIAEDITARKKAEQEKENLVCELQVALEEVKILSGFLPICASCKKIRNDEGYWQQIESYLTQHSHAQFSHSLCPQCSRRLYPDFVDENGKVPTKNNR